MSIDDLIFQEFQYLQDIFSSNPPDFFAIEICRAMDYWATGNIFGIYDKDTKSFSDSIRWGYSGILKLFYETKKMGNGFPLFPSESTEHPRTQTVDYLLFHSGKIDRAKQMLEFEKANLIKFKEEGKNEFRLEFPNKYTGLEYFENESVSNYFLLLNKYFIEPRRKKHMKSEKTIHEKMRNLVEPWKEYYIKYDTTSEIDDYYSRLGYFQFIGSQLYDSFGETAVFGGIEYKKYLDVLQDLMGIAIKHIDYCVILLDKCPQMNPRNILSICVTKKELIPQYANYLSLEEYEINQIFDCLTVHQGNIDYHSRQLKNFSPPFIKVSKTHLMRSLYGILSTPTIFLLRELKRLYGNDYNKNVNSREKIFRKQLYELISREGALTSRLITINHEVEIKCENIRTDIDAVMFDKKTGSLGLFQLKWQEIFVHDTKERFSRISNFYPKANEWLEKIYKLIDMKTNKELLDLLGLTEIENPLSNIYLFVLNRTNTHFTGTIPDARAAWGTWYHVLKLSHNIATDFNDPIRELYIKLKLDSPLDKTTTVEVNDFELKFSDFRMFYKNN